MSITYKDAAGVQGMRTAGRLASEVLDHITPFIKPGITTKEIDQLAAQCMHKQGSVSATLPDSFASLSKMDCVCRICRPI